MSDPVTSAPPPAIGTVWTMRVCAVIITVTVIVQPLWIGMFLKGDPAMLIPHGAGAGVILLANLVFLFAAGLWRRRAKGDRRPLAVSAVFLATVLAQAMAGMNRMFEWHFPIGVIMATGAVALATLAWQLPSRHLGGDAA